MGVTWWYVVLYMLGYRGPNTGRSSGPIDDLAKTKRKDLLDTVGEKEVFGTITFERQRKFVAIADGSETCGGIRGTILIGSSDCGFDSHSLQN